MDEGSAWDQLRPQLQALGLDPHRVENVAGVGTPDVWYVAGGIELKWLEAWPRRANTQVIIKTLVERPQQVAWLMRRWAYGGPAWVMVRVDRQWLLFAGCHARIVRQGLERVDLVDLAVWRTNERGAGNWADLRHWLLWEEKKLPAAEGRRLRHLIDEGGA